MKPFPKDRMPLGFKEKIDLPIAHPFRMLRWNGNFQNLEILSNAKEAVKVESVGNDWHYHREIQLTLFTQGKGTRFVGNNIASFNHADLVLVGENLPHYWRTDGESAGLSMQWYFPASHPLWTFSETANLVQCFREAALGIRFTGRTAHRIADQLHAFADAEDLARLGILLEIFSSLSTAPAEDRRQLSTRKFVLPAESRHLGAMQSAVQFLLAHFREDVRLNEVLEVTCMSKPTFSRVFKAHTGKTMLEFLQHIRLDAVCRELVETDKPIIEIAFNNGFSQTSYFNRLFRRTLKCSPSAYRILKRSS